MAFSYDLTANSGKVRLKLSDTDSAAYAFEDDEIAYLLTEGGSVDGAVVVGLKVLLTDRARRSKRFSLQGVSYDDTATVAALKEALKVYGGDLPTVTVNMPALLPMDAGYTEITST